MLEYILIGILVLLILYNQWSGRYWARQGIAGPHGLPLIGNMYQFTIGRQHYSQVYDELYQQYPNAKFVGFYRIFNNPSILIKDLDLVKEIMIKSFPNFHNNALYMSKERDPLAAINPFVAKDELWKLYRSQLLPAFSPSKVKTVFPCINDVCEKLIIYIGQGSESDNPNHSFEAKTLCSMFTLEVVASCAFGLEGQTFSNDNSDFTKLVKDIFQPRQFVLLETISLLFSAEVGNLINYNYIPKNIENWLTTIIGEVINQRQQAKESRNDFLQTLLDLKDKRGMEMTETEIVGHCMTMLIEGFETSSTLMSFVLYELSVNTEIQEKAQHEIDSILVKYNGNLCYDAIQEMIYLENILFETLRLHPPMYTLFKLCTEPFRMPPQFPNSKNQITVPTGTAFMIPVSAIHNDPEIYPNPMIFDPERFNEENQRNRSKCSYLGFGEGPRMCLGMRFGLAQSKAGLASILSNFTVKLSRNCQSPIEMSPNTFLLTSKHGISVQFAKRFK